MDLSIRAELKQTTKSLHQWLENADALKILHKETISETEYFQLMEKMKLFFQQLELLLIQFQAEFEAKGLTDFTQRLQRSQWLSDDLQNHSSELAPDNKINFQALNNFSGAVGALYVCEGSNLGGMQIKPLLQQRLGEHLPYYFYTGYGEDNMTQWQSFTRWLDSIEVEREKTILGACEVFIQLRACLDS